MTQQQNFLVASVKSSAIWKMKLFHRTVILAIIAINSFAFVVFLSILCSFTNIAAQTSAPDSEPLSNEEFEMINNEIPSDGNADGKNLFSSWMI